MKSADDDIKRDLFDSESIKGALLTLKVQASQLDPEKFSLVYFLDDNHILKEGFQTRLEKWPKPIQTYINKQLMIFASNAPQFKPEDLEIIGRFFETALQEPEPCGDEQYQISEERWNDAMKALAQELRRYYGLEENDTEFPCWRFG
jgi:hypothetical protein